MVEKARKTSIFSRFWHGITNAFFYVTNAFSDIYSSILTKVANKAIVRSTLVPKDTRMPDILQDLGFQPFCLFGNDNTKLYGFHYLENSSRPTVIFFHGRGSTIFKTKSQGETGILKLLVGAGYNVITVDPPGYGKSVGDQTVEGVANTAVLLRDYIRDSLRFDNGKKINLEENGIVIGRSLGAIPAAKFASLEACKGEIIIVPTTNIHGTIKDSVLPGFLQPTLPWLKHYHFPILEDTKNTQAENALIIYNSYDHFAPPETHVVPLLDQFPARVNLLRHDVALSGGELRYRNHIIPNRIIFGQIRDFIDGITVNKTFEDYNLLEYMEAKGVVDSEPLSQSAVSTAVTSSRGQVVYDAYKNMMLSLT